LERAASRAPLAREFGVTAQSLINRAGQVAIDDRKSLSGKEGLASRLSV
jgi:hypothetical protein